MQPIPEASSRFSLLRDPADNKFVDCAIAANTACIVSYDGDSRALREVKFPKVLVVDTAGFWELLGE
ncbi:PIN domain-containing protein [Hymenobacter psoromatis]|uniref:PIN domain-containing protein n=1 Tax=Hymenobacter psoromatis TaxID=1484116 RepID=UPI001CC14CA8|nr:PIN domain-containing protein [Hymenobacter psoromatis]